MTLKLSTTLLRLACLLFLALPAHAELHYRCEDLAAMAGRFQGLKARQRSLEEVLDVVQRAAAGNPDKETLLSNLAIEIYIDPAIETAAQARALANKRCRAARAD